jgi:iron complex outermembrane receptor protein
MIKKDGYRDRGIPFINDKLVVPIENTTQEPSDQIDSISHALLGIFTHRFQDESNFDVKMRYLSNTQDIQHHQPEEVLEDGTTMKRYFRRFDKENETLSITTNWGKGFESENFKHYVVVGGDYMDDKSKNHVRQANSILDGGQVGSIDIFHPVFGQTDPSTYIYDRGDTDTTGKRQLFGLFTQYQVTAYNDLHLMGSLRYEHYDDETDSLNKLTSKQTNSDYDDNAFSFRGGILYQIIEPIGMFISYDQAYQPQSTGNQDPIKGGPFDPEESYQWELGAKTNWFDKRLNVNLTYYHINKQNTLQTDPNDNTKLQQLGEVQSKGVEVEVIGHINENWWLVANYAHNHVEITEDRDPTKLGKKPTPAQPDNIGSLWVNYRKPMSWNFGFGMNSVSSRAVGGSGTQFLPSYVRWDASIGYEFQHYKLRLFVENIDNQVYYTGGYGGVDGALPGAPRTFGASVEWRY